MKMSFKKAIDVKIDKSFNGLFLSIISWKFWTSTFFRMYGSWRDDVSLFVFVIDDSCVVNMINSKCKIFSCEDLVFKENSIRIFERKTEY